MSYLPNLPLHITPLLAFGLMLIIGAVGGYVAHRISWLPSITGFLLVGFICGPSGIGLLSQEAMVESQIFIDIALALILYRLGLSLDIKILWRSQGLFVTSLVESLVTFGLVFYVLHLFGMPTPVAVLVAAITISSSPSVLLHVAHEVGAKGVVTESTKTLVALNNLISFVAFSASLPDLHYSAGSDWMTIILQPLYQLTGSLLLGCALAYGLHTIAVKTQRASQYKLALVIGTVIVAIGLAHELKLSMLFAPLVIGVVIKNLERETVISGIEFGAPFELFFIVLFVFAGAGLHLEELVEFAPVVLVLVLARSFAKMFGTMATLPLFREPVRVGISSGMLLLPMAGLAIGLVQTSGNLFPQHASTISAIVLGAVAVFETIGPPIAALAFRIAGESGAMNRDIMNEDPDNTVKVEVL
ncbi:MAG TPA: cation:proton antiporter [Gallionella sp.]|nr:cation:proton antiporter [Gallionella sp.]